MYNIGNDKPRLTETHFGEFLTDRLKICHENRVKIYNNVLNIGIGVLFITVAGLFLY